MARKKQKNKNKLLWLLMVIVLVAAGIGGYFAMRSLSDRGETKEEIFEEQKQEERNKNDVGGSDDEKVDEEDGFAGKEIVQYEGDNANDSDSLTGVITYAAVVGNKLTIRVSIDQYLSNGTCGLTLSRGDDTIHSSIANIIGSASTSTCEGFDVPISELGGGAMDININLSSGEREGVIRGEVNI